MTTGGPVLHYAATSAWIAVPIQAMILGAALATLDLYWEPGTQTSAILLGVFAAGSAALWLRDRIGRERRLSPALQAGAVATYAF